MPKNHKLAPGHTDQGASKKKTFLLVVVPFTYGNLEPIGNLLYLDTKLSYPFFQSFLKAKSIHIFQKLHTSLNPDLNARLLFFLYKDLKFFEFSLLYSLLILELIFN